MFGQKFANLFASKHPRLASQWKEHVKLQSILLWIPYCWSILFFLLPTILVCKISFARSIFGLPPFSDLIQHAGHYFYEIYLYFGNYAALCTDSFYFSALFSSAIIAGSVTLCCLVIGYTFAYAISRTPKHTRPILILLIVLPFVTSFLIRVYSWMSLLNTQGVVNNILIHLGLITRPVHFLDNNFAVGLGMVYCYLPFMVFPIYAALDKIDPSYIESALDLGASNWSAFWHITVPLSMPGVMAGCALVAVPSLGEFVIPELLGGAKTMTIGQAIWNEFFHNRDWPLACAIAVLMMFSFVFCVILSKIKDTLIKS